MTRRVLTKDDIYFDGTRDKGFGLTIITPNTQKYLELKEQILENQRKSEQYDVMTKYVVSVLTKDQRNILGELLDPITKRILVHLAKDKKK